MNNIGEIAMIVACSNSLGIAAIVARRLKDRLVIPEKRVFPDGELYVRVPAEPDERAIVINSLLPPQDRSFMELLLTVEALRGMGVDDVTLVIPYMAYSRQDKRFLPGEPISLKVILETLSTLGASEIVTIDVHNEEGLRKIAKIKVTNLLPTREFAKYFKERLNPRTVVLAPDKGALKRASTLAGELGLDYDYIEKVRDRVSGEVKALPKEINVEDKDVLIVDDIISTGGTIALAARSIKERGGKDIYAVCTHALLVHNALDKIYESGVSEVIATDTVPSPVSKITIAPLIVEYLVKKY